MNKKSSQKKGIRVHKTGKNVNLPYASADIVVMLELYEGTNMVVVNYITIADNAGACGSSSTFGFQTAGGASSTAYPMGFNTEVLDQGRLPQFMSFKF